MKIAVLIIKGIGDTLHAIPALKALRQAKPGASITVVVADRSSGELIAASGLNLKPVVLPFRAAGRFLYCLRVLYGLRRERFDASITMFPSNRVWYNIFALVVNARLRITHRYPCGRLRALAFLQNKRVDAPRGLHTVEHNLNLLSALDIDPIDRTHLGGKLIHVPETAATQAAYFLTAAFPSSAKKPVALHVSISDAMVYKRWDHANIELFARLAERINTSFDRPVVLIAGPGEKGTADAIAALCGCEAAVCNGFPILSTAALLERCALLINTDSGIGHVAASLAVPVITIFGPANPAMTRPYGASVTVIRKNLSCSPCYSYPYDSCAPRISCADGECFGPIDMDEVMAAASAILTDRTLP